MRVSHSIAQKEDVQDHLTAAKDGDIQHHARYSCVFAKRRLRRRQAPGARNEECANSQDELGCHSAVCATTNDVLTQGPDIEG